MYNIVHSFADEKLYCPKRAKFNLNYPLHIKQLL